MAELKIKPRQIKVGYAIKLPCSWMKHPFLSASFTVENKKQIAIILGLSLDFVFFYPEKSNIERNKPESKNDALEIETVDEQTAALHRQKKSYIEAAKEHHRAIQRTEKAFAHTLGEVKSMMKMLSSRPLNTIDESKKLISNMTDTILGAESLVIHLMTNGKKEEQNFYFHSLNVAVLSMLLAEKTQCSADELEAIGIGALFHDVGKLKIPSQVLRKRSTLTTPEQILLKMHPRYGAELVDLAGNFPARAKEIIEQHHEYSDGTGYPKGLFAEDINKLASIVCIANEFDNLCHPLDPEKTKTPHHALSFMFIHMKDKFNQEILAEFIKLMGIYPPGTIVQLSDARFGIVMSTNKHDLTHPDILIYDPEIPRSEAPISHLNDSLKIIKAATEADLSPEIMIYLNPNSQNNYYFDSNKSH